MNREEQQHLKKQISFHSQQARINKDSIIRAKHYKIVSILQQQLFRE